jgi:DNA-binding NarL/FixJ family response regulator
LDGYYLEKRGEKIRVILAEDYAIIREGTRRILDLHPDIEVVGEAEDGLQALELIKQLRPDVAILDIRMPKVNGIEVVREMNKYSPGTRALMLTAYDDDVYIMALMQAGATGYILKTAHENELVDAIRSVNAGESVLHPGIAVKIARLWAQRNLPEPAATFDQLSHREIEVLGLAARGLRNKAIAEKLNISIHTVEGHFNVIFAKLRVSSRTEAVIQGLSRGLISLEKD